MALTPERNEGGNNDGPSIDYDELNKYLVETCGLTQPETLTGYISQVVELGMQEQPDGKMESKLTPAEEAEFLEKEKEEHPDSTTYFETMTDWSTRTEKRYKRWKSKPCNCVTFAVDFPDIMIDWSKFYEDSEPKPLRMWLGGLGWISSDREFVVQNPFALRESKKEFGAWSLPSKGTLYKMAVAAKVGETGKPIPASIYMAMLGKALQFECQVFLKPSKDGSKQYLTEKCKFVGGLPRGMPEPEKKTPCDLVEFEGPTAREEAIGELKNHVKNTIKRATNYADSPISYVLDRKAESQSVPADDEEDQVPF